MTFNENAIDVSFPELRDIVRAAARVERLPRFASVSAPAGSASCGGIGRRIKLDGSGVTHADSAMQERLQSELMRRWPRYTFLGEEMTALAQQDIIARAGEGMWCLDPLDGTTNFAAGLPFFGVSLALLSAAGPVLGMVYDPLRDECFSARAGAGAWLNDAPLKTDAAPAELRRCVAAVDLKRLPKPLAAALGSAPPYGSQRNFGAATLEWCWLAAGRFHLYLHGAQKLWDYAAGSLIAREAGASAATLDGEPVFAFGLAPRSVIAAADAAALTKWKAWVVPHARGA